MADERRAEAIQVSPEERRFLHRFVRRTMRPWIAGVGALAALALGVALSSPPPAALGAAVPGEHASAAHDELRAEIARLRDELTVLRSKGAPTAQAGSGDTQHLRERADAAERSARTLEARLQDELEPRLAKLEAAFAAQPALAPGAAAEVPPAFQGDLASIRDRLYDLETRLGDLPTSEQRIQRLELRLSELEGVPAAPAPR